MEEEQILLKEFEKWFKKNGLFGMKNVWFSCAKYFFELGRNDKAGVLESEKPMEQERLNEEIDKEIDELWAIKRDNSGQISNGMSEWKGKDQLMNIPAIRHFARHFAQWGAEHLSGQLNKL